MYARPDVNEPMAAAHLICLALVKLPSYLEIDGGNSIYAHDAQAAQPDPDLGGWTACLERKPEGFCRLVGLQAQVPQVHIGHSKEARISSCTGVKHLKTAMAARGNA